MKTYFTNQPYLKETYAGDGISGSHVLGTSFSMRLFLLEGVNMSERYLMDTWPGKMNLQDVTVWGIDPLLMLNDIFDREIFDEDAELVFLHYEQKSKLQNLTDVLYRFDLYQMLLERRLKEFAPEDPLLTNPEELVKKELREREEISACRKADREEKNQKFKRLCEIVDKNDLTEDVFIHLSDVVAREEKKNGQKKNMIKKVSLFTEEEMEQLFKVVMTFQDASEKNQGVPEAQNQSIGA